MQARQRRETILKILREQDKPVSASSLAAQLGVSRQIIVGDIALLRAANADILATPRGYILHAGENAQDRHLYTIACRHERANLGEELYLIVDYGGRVLDVIVEHPLYGQISGQLQIHSRYDVDNFLAALETYRATPLCNLTDGVHLHTIWCEEEAVYRRIIDKLREKGFLFEAK